MEETPESPVTEAAPVDPPSPEPTTPEPAATGSTAQEAGAEPAAPMATDVQPAAGKGEKRSDRKKNRTPKVKVVRDSFTMPKPEYEQIASIKALCLASGVSVKKSELIRAGIGLLARMTADEVAALVRELPVIKTGRPKKRK